MRNEVSNCQQVGFIILTYKTKHNYVGFLTRTYKTKHNTDRPFLLQDCKNVSINILSQKACLG